MKNYIVNINDGWESVVKLECMEMFTNDFL